MTTTLTLLDPTLDYVFKKMFTADTGILVDLINSVLRLSDERQILTADVKNPDILPDHITQKYIILDISAVDDSGRHYDIEMQVRKYESYSKRMRTYYKNPAIHKAFNILETLSADEKVRREAEMREKALKNEISELAAAKREGMKKGMKEGMKEGREKEKKDNAKNLLKMGVLTLEQIAEATGLSEEDVSEIQKNL